MARIGLLRRVTPGMLFILATMVTTTTLVVQLADASDSPSDNLTVACGAEITSCQEDETCTSCSTITEESSARFNACSTAGVGDVAETSTVYCLGHRVGVCCLDHASELNCLENDPFVKYWMCSLDAGGCSVDKIACGNDVMGGSSGAVADL